MAISETYLEQSPLFEDKSDLYMLWSDGNGPILKKKFADLLS